MEKYNNISSSYILKWEKTWPEVVIFSGIHGNEHAWIKAHMRLKAELENGVITLIAWTLIWVTHANEEAIKINKREVEKNLNRLFLDDNVSKDCYEDARAQELKSILVTSDYLLDLHSTSGPSVPFAFVEKEQLAFYEKLGIKYLVAGWWELEWDVISWDTENYINSKWWAGITFESGDHNNPEWEDIAYRVILNYLCITGCIDMKHFQSLDTENNSIHMSDVYVAKTDRFSYSLETSNFMNIDSGTEIARDGEDVIVAPYDMVLVMPKKQEIVTPWVEVFFTWKKI